MAVFSKFAVSVAAVAVGYEEELSFATAPALQMKKTIKAAAGFLAAGTAAGAGNRLQQNDLNASVPLIAKPPVNHHGVVSKIAPKSSPASSAFCRLFEAVANGELESVSTAVDRALPGSTESDKALREQMIKLLREYHQEIKEACKFVDTAGFDVEIKKHIENGQLTKTALQQLREWVGQQQSSANVARDARFKKLDKDIEKTAYLSFAGCDVPDRLVILGSIVIPLWLLVCVLNCICCCCRDCCRDCCC